MSDYAVDDYVVLNESVPVPANLAGNTPMEERQPSVDPGLTASLRGR